LLESSVIRELVMFITLLFRLSSKHSRKTACFVQLLEKKPGTAPLGSMECYSTIRADFPRIG
jgi:hypothetical protein